MRLSSSFEFSTGIVLKVLLRAAAHVAAVHWDGQATLERAETFAPGVRFFAPRPFLPSEEKQSKLRLTPATYVTRMGFPLSVVWQSECHNQGACIQLAQKGSRTPMDTAIALLRKEHDAILRMLDLTDEVARQLDGGGRVKPETLSGLLEFFQLFADRCHHGKEEELLFPLLEQKGVPRDGGPIGVMLFEHEKGRSLIRQMVDSAEAYAGGAADAGSHWAAAAWKYSALLRDHIMKENEVLFRIAEWLLADAEQQELAAAFDKVEVDKMGAGTHERLHALMDKLAGEILAAKS